MIDLAFQNTDSDADSDLVKICAKAVWKQCFVVTAVPLHHIIA